MKFDQICANKFIIMIVIDLSTIIDFYGLIN